VGRTYNNGGKYYKEIVVRFSLQDVKKSVHRHAGELFVTLHFLRSGDLQNEIQQLIAYYEGLLEQPQRAFSLDDARTCIGDYRLAHCLIATLSHWYSWQSREWKAALQALNVADALAELPSPIHLRLALYTYVSEQYHGFLGTQERAQALQAFAEMHGISMADLEYLLALDSETEALLTRLTDRPPTAQEVASLYNQWVFEAALFNASDVRFVLDCSAFSDAQASEGSVSMGLGAVIKRLCYLARKLGVYYDLAYESTLLDGPLPGRLLLTLYGPQDITGAPQQYGLRLARLCRLLLPAYGNSRGQGQRRSTIKTRAIIEAVATVHFLQRAYCFTMDTDLLRLLPGDEQATEQNSSSESSTLFDSSIEQAFSEAFMALAAGQGVDGWRLEREPEPFLLEQSIFIPDFALTRGQQRIYVEILGFWTPSYRERKIQKLQQLKERKDLILAIPLDAREAFATIEADFPIVFYQEQIAVTDVLQILRSRYDNFAERLAQIDSSAVQDLVRRVGLLPERVRGVAGEQSSKSCYEALYCYRRSELASAAELVLACDILFVPGIGLYYVAWLEQFKNTVLAWLRSKHVASLQEIVQEAQTQWSSAVAWDDSSLEILLTAWPEIYINRTSIFDITIELAEEVQIDQEAIITSSPQLLKQEGKKQVYERRSPLQKRKSGKSGARQRAIQEGLWD
jgi:predicted nuclease of restriction endonuclease-like RecB superfamily